MRRVIYIVLVAVSAIFVSACSKDDLGNGENLPYITFGISGLDIETKSLITGNLLENNPNKLRDCVYVYGVRNNTDQIYSKTPIMREQNSSNWQPSNKRQWAAGSSYSFYAYTSSPAASASAPTSDNGGIYVEHSGLKITVLQPKDYNEANMVDYMLSHAYKVADGANYRTVMLYMQHAMAWIEIVVQKEMPEHTITLNSITLGNIFRSATMQCESQGIANSGEKNIWMVQLSGTNDLSYTKNSFVDSGTYFPLPDNYNSETYLGAMNLLTVPQQLSSKATLTVSYSVDEDDNNETPQTEYSQTFQLFNYIPYVWESGNKITYTLSINTGVALKASISDWKDAGYTEGVVLPGNGTGNNN